MLHGFSRKWFSKGGCGTVDSRCDRCYRLTMKQLLLRVPDELHRRLARRAQREHRSVNALATEVLSLATSIDPSVRRDRLRMQVALAGLGASHEAYLPGSSTADDRAEAVAAMKGVGPVIDEIIAEGRRHG